MDNRSQIRHDIINNITSILAQIEISKRKSATSLVTLKRLEKKVMDLHQQFIKYVSEVEQ